MPSHSNPFPSHINPLHSAEQTPGWWSRSAFGALVAEENIISSQIRGCAQAHVVLDSAAPTGGATSWLLDMTSSLSVTRIRFIKAIVAASAGEIRTGVTNSTFHICILHNPANFQQSPDSTFVIGPMTSKLYTRSLHRRLQNWYSMN